VLFDAPPSIGHNLRRAVDEIAAAEGVTSTVTHIVYSHHHADHAGASSLFGRNVVRIGHQETRRLLLRDNDPARPAPEVTFADRYTLDIGGERVQLAWHGPNHCPDNIYIHFPGHDTLMLVDIVNSGWVPIYNLNLSEDVPGYIQAPSTALSYPWKHFIGGHLGRPGTRDDIAVHQQYVADIEASARTALTAVDPTPYFQKYGENVWAAVKTYLDAVTDYAAAPIIAKYTGVLAAACSPPAPRSRSSSRSASTSATAHRSTPEQDLPGAGERRPRASSSSFHGTRSLQMPALLTSTSTCPVASTAAAAAVDTDAVSLTLQRHQFVPSSSAVASTSSALKSS
jgi:glyoxylase-like metal-dependent hydrolase (beta-lactamase superfamily II)